MMRTVSFVDCRTFLTAVPAQQPVVMYRRRRDRPEDGGVGFTAAKTGFGDTWFVNTKAVSVEGQAGEFVSTEDPEMSRVVHEELVRIPLFRYYTGQRDLRLLFAFGAQIGATARETLKVKQVLELHLAIGDVFDRAEENKLEFYLGLAFRCRP